MKRRTRLDKLEEGDAFESDETWFIVTDEFDDDNGNRVVVDVETGTILRFEPDRMVQPVSLYFCEE